MLRSQAIRVVHSTAPAVPRLSGLAVRTYVTTPPPPSGQPAPNPKAKDASPKSNNTMLYTVLGLAAVAGGYYYYMDGGDRATLRKKVKEGDEETKRRARASFDTGKARVDDAKAAGEDKLASARLGVDATLHDTEERARQLGADAQAKYEAYKSSAQKSLTDARDSTENLYNEARSATDRKVAEVRSEVEKKAGDVKGGWFGWLGWGKSKTDEGKREAAGKVADTAEDVRNKANKHI